MLQLDPQQHHVQRVGSLSGWLEREFPDRKLFIFWNSFSGVWEIGEWISGDLCHEWCIVGPDLGAFDRPKAQLLRFDLVNTNDWMKERARRLRAKSRYENGEQADKFKDFQDRMRYFCRRHPHKASALDRARAGLSGAA